MSLVADYGDSSATDEESDSDSSVVNDSPPESTDLKEAAPKLPAPDFVEANSSQTSVFSNPFKQAEEEKRAILEKHVKMVSTQENVRSINGKKVCWNYRKGKCRFGHNCIYAHDSDVQKTGEVQQAVLCHSETDRTSTSRSKKRPGLTQGLVPGKKIMKNYHKQSSTILINKK
ncbi:hypothetical protein PPYR_12487 [Photinus pyralis]|uniref:C3H1-type domain-containing protein n=1 Tax=Photinus pyralis TaxID=7054 RepID=A0A1Y1LZV9_PHOPY|nr:uncharacterized protein LOC116175878 [Photinus pyralis]KAB0795648.1 hypothetical protein PPYR_12487 [Photinus pyralis]